MIFDLEFYTQPYYQSSVWYKDQKKKVKVKRSTGPGNWNQLRKAVKPQDDKYAGDPRNRMTKDCRRKFFSKKYWK